jgi:hypothetical protein
MSNQRESRDKLPTGPPPHTTSLAPEGIDWPERAVQLQASHGTDVKGSNLFGKLGRKLKLEASHSKVSSPVQTYGWYPDRLVHFLPKSQHVTK